MDARAAAQDSAWAPAACSEEVPSATGTQSLPARALREKPHNAARRGERACRMTFYCNGDPYYKGCKLSVSLERYSRLQDLQVELDRALPPAIAPIFGVRQLYTPSSGRRVTALAQLRDGGRYVCSGFEAFKGVGYGQVDEVRWSHGVGRLFCDGKRNGIISPLGFKGPQQGGTALDGWLSPNYPAESICCATTPSLLPIQPPCPQRLAAAAASDKGPLLLPPLHFSGRLPHASGHDLPKPPADSCMLRLPESKFRQASFNKTAMVLLMRSGGNHLLEERTEAATAAVAEGGAGYSAVCMLLNRRGLKSYEALLADISEAFGLRWRLNRVRRLYSLSGRVVMSISDMFRRENVFLAVGRERVSKDNLEAMVDEFLPKQPFPAGLWKALKRSYPTRGSGNAEARATEAMQGQPALTSG